jgi:hypothetical protein
LEQAGLEELGSKHVRQYHARGMYGRDLGLLSILAFIPGVSIRLTLFEFLEKN